MMPVIGVWIVPTVIAVGVTQFYLIAVASLVEAALALARPTTDTPLDRRGKFKVIEGGKTVQTSRQ